MDKRDPYNFEKTEKGLEKRFRIILSQRQAYKLKQKRKKSGAK